MARKSISDEEAFNILDPSLSEFISLDESEDSNQLFDELVTINKRYNQSSIVNQGGMKKIFKTIDSLTNRPVAKATLINCEDEEKAENFLREARLTAALEHPNIIPVYDIGVDEEEGPYFIMKLVGGKNLGDIIKGLSKPDNQENLSLSDLMAIFIKVCDAVAFAHSKGIVHLDLKPENIQVDDYGEVLVCDWGLAKVLDYLDDVTESTADLDPMLYNDLTLDGIIKGTPGYMAPEQINTDLGPKNKQTDVYALGGILYSLLCLKTPYESDTVEAVIEDTLLGELILPSKRVQDRSIPPSLEAVAMKALETKMKSRYQSVSELRDEINKWLGGFATEAENASFLKSARLLLNRHKAVSSLLFLLLISAGFAFYKIKQNESRALLNEQKAQKALKELVNERKFSLLVSDNAIEQLKVSYENSLDEREFEKALTFINKTVKLHPGHELLNTLKGEVHFYMQEFSQSIKAFEKAGSYKLAEPYKTMISLAPKYAALQNKGHIPPADLVDLVRSFDGKYKNRALAFMTERISTTKKYQQMFKSSLNRLKIDQHMEFCRIMILSDPTNIKNPLSLNFKYVLHGAGIELDLSNSKFDKISLIKHLPLKSLNLENSTIWRKWVFQHSSLKELNIKNSFIKNITREDILHNPLSEIILSKDQYESNRLDRIIDIRKGLKLIVK